jgi:hypothetical protein
MIYHYMSLTGYVQYDLRSLLCRPGPSAHGLPPNLRRGSTILTSARRCLILLITTVLSSTDSCGVLSFKQLCDRCELNVARAFVYSPYFAISPHLFGDAFSDESHASHELDPKTTHSLSNLRGV